MVVVYNGRTEAELFSRESARSFFATHIPALKNYMNDFWSVTVGELHRIKQHDVTIRALAKITATYPNVRHIIISDGEERSNLEVLVRELQLESHVFFAGHIPEATQYLKAFDLFVLASRSESLAYVLIEACIAGLPSIASNVGGIPEVIRNEHEGLLFPQGDTSALAQAYVRLYEDGTLREKLSENASRRAKEFTFEKMLEKTIGVYAISSLAE